MAKKPKKKKVALRKGAPEVARTEEAPVATGHPGIWAWALPLVAGLIAFLAYWPSLSAGFVYDGRYEILEEGFITSLSHLREVITLQVLGMNLMLGDRPGQMLYLMLLAAVCGREPLGYHVASNLLHAANVALLFVLLFRLAMTERAGLPVGDRWKVRWAALAASLIFALHPIAVETVSEINFSSDLLATGFTLLALLAATVFSPGNFRLALGAGVFGVLCCLAAVGCKESGVAAPFVVFAYWFLYRRGEAKGPWLLWGGASFLVTLAFLAARFYFAPSIPGQLGYLGGSFSQVFLIQPRFWVFMMGKLVWPAQLSADYTLENVAGLTTMEAVVLLAVVLGLQVWLARKSRLGALGVAIFWLGLATVSNFIPLYCILADRFYYLPLAGVAMQVMALLRMTFSFRLGFAMSIALCLMALVPLLVVTWNRQAIFIDESKLCTATLQVSPASWRAHNGMGLALMQKGRLDEAISHYERSLEIYPDSDRTHLNLGAALLQEGKAQEAASQFRQALEINPASAEGHNNLGLIFSAMGQADPAQTEFEKALAVAPQNADAHNNLGNLLFGKGQPEAALAQYKMALASDPHSADAYNNWGRLLLSQELLDEAAVQFRKALEFNPRSAEAHNNLGIVLIRQGQVEPAIGQFQEALRLKPGFSEAQNNLGKAQSWPSFLLKKK